MTLPFDEQGDGPALVLLHAGVADRGMWSAHMPVFAQAGYRVIAPDLPGFGEAGDTAGMSAPWSAVAGLLDELQAGPAHILGNSFGAAVALRVALLRPELAASLVLVSSSAPGVEPSPQLEAAWAKEEAALERGDRNAAAEAVVDTWTQPGADPQLREMIVRCQLRAYEIQHAAEEDPEAEDPLDEDPAALAAIAAPALVMVGELDMEDFQISAGVLASGMRDAGELTLPGVGHLAPLEAPEMFSTAALAFIAALA